MGRYNISMPDGMADCLDEEVEDNLMLQSRSHAVQIAVAEYWFDGEEPWKEETTGGDEEDGAE